MMLNVSSPLSKVIAIQAHLSYSDTDFNSPCGNIIFWTQRFKGSHLFPITGSQVPSGTGSVACDSQICSLGPILSSSLEATGSGPSIVSALLGVKGKKHDTGLSRRDGQCLPAFLPEPQNMLLWLNHYLSESFGNIWNVVGGPRDHPAVKTPKKAFQNNTGQNEGGLLPGAPSAPESLASPAFQSVPREAPPTPLLSQCVMFGGGRKTPVTSDRTAI